jgi:hypothetical protein
VQFLLTCCFNESKWASLPAAERDRLMDEYGRLVGELKERGTLLSGAKLDVCASAVTVRRREGKPLLLDGPFAETKEQVGGYHVIECRDRDEAVAIALRIPTLAAGGVVEVRPLLFAG